MDENTYIKEAEREYARCDYPAAQVSTNMSVAYSLHSIAESLSLIEMYLETFLGAEK